MWVKLFCRGIVVLTFLSCKSFDGPEAYSTPIKGTNPVLSKRTLFRLMEVTWTSRYGLYKIDLDGKDIVYYRLCYPDYITQDSASYRKNEIDAAARAIKYFGFRSARTGKLDPSWSKVRLVIHCVDGRGFRIFRTYYYDTRSMLFFGI